MKAIVHEGIAGFEGLSYRDMEEQPIHEHMVKVQLKTAGMNRRDLAITNRHKTDDPGLILGSDGAGIVTEIGQKVQNVQVGDEVIINPALGWNAKSDAPPKGFEILGLPDHGTFAEMISISSEQVEKKPSHLTFEEAGTLALAALTGFRALFTRAGAKEGDTVLLPGIGSGVLTFILKFAKASGMRTIVTSRSEEKRAAALELGADKAIDTNEDWNEALRDEEVDIVIESIGKATFDKSLGIVRRGGTVVTFGATTEDTVEIDIRKFFYGQYNLLGTTMGSREEFRDMLQFIEKHDIKPEVDRMFPLDQFNEAFTYMKESKNFGKIGFTI
ncbi:alcohol dehydrogenase [Pontibacillus halophilus JSM 076056 = DSM 19796]|uniref:Alcohol dehydrogenase n=1 Tax=Pontibacillus halophilus JSM 076056 = DSM 19796 TaxID=1385510 RepID=A0A0A5GJ55_9BACI|nr:zinc-binding dehydrogenase [Pontibacillus halophilus]KGX91999.1 alcohol dehydrogenase [Pontibacillus halophilus JSM 076056 = DSM 19796]